MDVHISKMYSVRLHDLVSNINMAAMLRDTDLINCRLYRMPELAIYATSQVDHEKRVTWFSILIYTCMWFCPLGCQSEHQKYLYKL